MKYFLLLAIACMFSVLGVAQTATDTTYVEILYFHGRQRCVTCKAIEEHTKEVVNTDLAEWVKNGKLRFKEVDISTPEGEKLAEKYQVSMPIVEEVNKVLKTSMYSAIVPRNVRLGEAPSYGLPITIYDPKSKGAESYRALAELVINKEWK